MASSSFSSPWPDPNSPVLSKIDFGVPRPELFKWLDIRDTFLGQNKRKQDITAALALARDCKHPDAVWLASIFEGRYVSKPDQARKVFVSNETNDPRCLCFAWYMSDNTHYELDLPLLVRAAEMGNAFACATLRGQASTSGNKKEAFLLAQQAASKHERDGFYWHGYNARYGIGCEEDLTLAKESFLIAAELGHVFAMSFYALFFDDCGPSRWIWLGRAALGGLPEPFLGSFSKQVQQFSAANASVVFAIGRALRGNITTEKKLIFNSWSNFDALIGPANRAISFYKCQVASARLAVDAWALVAIRLQLIKDIRIFIGKLIWEGRFEANYTSRLQKKKIHGAENKCTVQ